MPTTIGKKPVLLNDLTYGGSKMFDSNGEFNAANKADAFKMQASLMKKIHSNEVLTEEEAAKKEEAAANRAATLDALMADATGQLKAAVGVAMAGSIRENIAKMGFMRQILTHSPLDKGQWPIIDVEDKQVEAAIIIGPTEVRPQFTREKYIYPPEYSITTRLLIEELQIQRSRKDLLHEKYNEGLEAILIQEDRQLKLATDTLVDNNDQAVAVSGQFTPAIFGQLLAKIEDYSMSGSVMLMASDVHRHILMDGTASMWVEQIDPVTRFEIFRSGEIGSIHGIRIITDAIREVRQKVLNKGEVYMYGPSMYVGEYTDRGGINAQPLTAAETGINGLGWHLSQLMSLAVVNHRTVARAKMS